MTRGKMIYISDNVHQNLKMMAARRRRTMGALVEEWVEREMSELANPWTGTGGLLLQQKAIEKLWSDPALDIYNDE